MKFLEDIKYVVNHSSFVSIDYSQLALMIKNYNFT